MVPVLLRRTYPFAQKPTVKVNDAALQKLVDASFNMLAPERFITTFSQGQTLDGYFLDCWPATDRLNSTGRYTLPSGLTRVTLQHVG